ncbi:unnamed protein product [Choristocarpus tenellus]
MRVAGLSRFLAAGRDGRFHWSILRRGIRPFSLKMAPSNEEERWEYDHDVLIVGGGIVGCALACRLATNPTTAGLRVGLVEARPPIGQWRGGGGPDDSGREVKRDPRVYSLTPASVRLLEEIGVWGMSGVGDEAEEFYNMQARFSQIRRYRTCPMMIVVIWTNSARLMDG